MSILLDFYLFVPWSISVRFTTYCNHVHVQNLKCSNSVATTLTLSLPKFRFVLLVKLFSTLLNLTHVSFADKYTFFVEL